jgi:hypothetical protein
LPRGRLASTRTGRLALYLQLGFDDPDREVASIENLVVWIDG